MTTTVLPPQLDRFIPLPKAARRLGIAKETLLSLVDSGRIKGAVLPNGEIGVSEPGLDQIVAREQFEHLRGQTITIKEAAEKFGIDSETLRKWSKRGYIRVLREGYGAEFDLADVAYCAAVYNAQGGMRGKRIFDRDGQPYQPKKSQWAEYQRARRKKKKDESIS